MIDGPRFVTARRGAGRLMSRMDDECWDLVASTRVVPARPRRILLGDVQHVPGYALSGR